MKQALLLAAGGSGFTFLLTTLGAATVFFLGSLKSPALRRFMLGFAAGVMIAASMWSLLIPAIESAQGFRIPAWVPAAGGSALGIAFLIAMDSLLPHLTPDFLRNTSNHGTALLAFAITMHNIPEGMAVGISFALAAQGNVDALPAAMALTFGIGVQNFPEGAAISLPLCQEGMGKGRAFMIGAFSGIMEPIAAILTVLAANFIQPLMPWLLSFAAGAMLYVVVEELIPEANLQHDHRTRSGTFGVMVGFLLMMILDVALS